MYDEIKIRAKGLIDKGLFNILGTSIINNIIAFINSIVIVCILSKWGNGIYTTARVQVDIFMLFSGLGISIGVLQFCSEIRSKDEKQRIFKYGFIVGELFNILLCIIILIYVAFLFEGIQEARIYILQLMWLPVFKFAFEYVAIIFRADRENKKYARVLNVNSISNFLLGCGGAYVFGISGAIAGLYASYALSAVIGLYIYRKEILKIIKASKIESAVLKSLIKYSSVCCLSNSASQMLSLLDTYLLGIFTIAETVGAYKVAQSIPSAMSFIPVQIMVFIYPYFAENMMDSKWLRKNTKKLMLILGIMNLIISLVLFIWAPLIIKIYRHDYTESILPFRILCVSMFFSGTFRVPAGNILMMIRKAKVNLVINIISGTANIILDIVLIKMFGSIGAAAATLLVVIISSLLEVIYLFIYLHDR